MKLFDLFLFFHRLYIKQHAKVLTEQRGGRGQFLCSFEIRSPFSWLLQWMYVIQIFNAKSCLSVLVLYVCDLDPLRDIIWLLCIEKIWEPIRRKQSINCCNWLKCDALATLKMKQKIKTRDRNNQNAGGRGEDYQLSILHHYSILKSVPSYSHTASTCFC